MKRLRIPALALLAPLALAAVAAPAAAQARVYFGQAGDTASGLQPGVEHIIPVRVANPYYYYYPLTLGRVSFVYDAAKVDVVGIDASCCASFYTGVDTSRAGPGQFTARASGVIYGTDVLLFRLRVRLLPGVTDGTYIWSRVDSLVFSGIGDYGPYAMTTIGQMCHATEIYGDVDGTATVTSRDALIALSAAVGLPTAGFNVALGDVDGDGLTNSRDALMILHRSISLAYPYTTILDRTGAGVPDACPGLTPPGETVVLRIAGATGGDDTIGVLGAGATAPVALPVTGGGTRQHPRLASDGLRILYNCNDQYGYRNVCGVNTDGSAFDTVLGGYNSFDLPDWSPAGDRFVVRDYGSYPARYDTGGVNRVQLSGAYYGPSTAAVIWSRSGATVTHTGYSGIRVVNPDTTGDSALTGGTFTDARLLRYTTGNDSLLLTRNDFAGIHLLSGGVVRRLFTFRMRDGASEELGFDAGPQGIVFAQDDPGLEGLWLLPSPTAPVVRLTRGRHRQPAFRRNP